MYRYSVLGQCMYSCIQYYGIKQVPEPINSEVTGVQWPCLEVVLWPSRTKTWNSTALQETYRIRFMELVVTYQILQRYTHEKYTVSAPVHSIFSSIFFIQLVSTIQLWSMHLLSWLSCHYELYSHSFQGAGSQPSVSLILTSMTAGTLNYKPDFL